MGDLLITDEYKVHHKFFFTLTINTSVTLISCFILLHMSTLFLYIKNLLIEYNLMIPFMLFNVVNNVYQVYAHIFTGTKFMGFKQITPLGSSDNQSLMAFTMSNIFDILGWLTIFVYYGYANPILAILASAHYGSEIVAIFFNKTFQKYFIEDPRQLDKSDNFGYGSWKIFRVCFVFTDALARGIMTYLMIKYFWY